MFSARGRREAISQSRVITGVSRESWGLLPMQRSAQQSIDPAEALRTAPPPSPLCIA